MDNRFSLLAGISALLLSTVSAEAAITVTNATMKSGQTLVAGTSTAGTMLTLDGLFSAPVIAGKFNFAIDDYHPDDCIVNLKTNAAGDPAETAVVALCGLRGLTPRGAWFGSNSYKLDDFVAYQGTGWIAKKAVPASTSGSTPGTDGEVYWKAYVAKGEQGIMGPHGDKGEKGDKGDDGEVGPPGPAGPAGPQGEIGPAGPQGEIGPAGADGADGATGPVGPAGADGATGPAGPAGPTGPAGADGVDGADGAAGPAGPEGPQGLAGNDGSIGPTGPVGPQGLAGTDGAPGPAGADGAAGPAGPVGPQGVAGSPGPQGPKGDTGATGPQGPQGATGPQGPAGDAGDIGRTVGAGTPFTLIEYKAVSICGSSSTSADIYAFMSQPSSGIVLGHTIPSPFITARGPGDFCITFVLPPGSYRVKPPSCPCPVGDINLVNGGAGNSPVSNLSVLISN